jgi:hypothetical protein
MGRKIDGKNISRGNPIFLPPIFLPVPDSAPFDVGNSDRKMMDKKIQIPCSCHPF